jgi:putative tryptophan/tyrosine transport system substrate-binding protein
LWALGIRRRLGFLAVGDARGQAPNEAEAALLDALQNHGWIDGSNLIIDYRYYGQSVPRLPGLAADLIALSPDVLIAAAPQALIALKSATVRIPIVFVAVADPVALGAVQSLGCRSLGPFRTLARSKISWSISSSPRLRQFGKVP